MSHLVFLISCSYYAAKESKRRERLDNSRFNIWTAIRENKSILIQIGLIISLTIFYKFFKEICSSFPIIYGAILMILSIRINYQANQKMCFNSLQQYKMYKRNLEILRKVLKNDYNLYSKEKIKGLISYCDEVSEEYRFKIGISNTILNGIKIILSIVITTLLNIFSDSIEASLYFIILIILLTILFILLLLPFSLMKENLNPTSNNINNLKGALIDLYLIDFEGEAINK